MQLFEYIDILNRPYDIFLTGSFDAPLHWHYYSEVLYIMKGKVAVFCNNKKAVLEEGDLCYIYPLQLHEVRKAQEGTQYAVLKFDIHTIHIPQAYLSRFYDIFLQRTKEADFCMILKNAEYDGEQTKELVEHIVKEYTEKKEFYSLQVQAGLYSLLINIARQIKKDKNRQDKTKKEKLTENEFTFYHILEYIDVHSGEALEIQQLADMCHMSYSHFAKLFRESYGRSCKEYIIYIRLNKAQDLLLHTNYDMNYIAAETGFCDCSHFIRSYKKWKGITPKQERLQGGISGRRREDSDG